MPARILIADDYDDNRELLRLLLVTAEYQVLEARDGQECLELARSHLPDLIMVDLSMPKLDGWEVFQALSADRRTSDIPCVAVTAYAEIDRNRALQTGFKAYVTKPFRTDELLEVVDRLLAERAVKVSVEGTGSEA
jgi:two-component system cell cycle response regulator DivK